MLKTSPPPTRLQPLFFAAPAPQRAQCIWHLAIKVGLPFAALLIALTTTGANASVFSKAYQCIAASGEAIVEGAEIGAKVLEFIATKPQCVAQLVTPPPAIPQIAMGITVVFSAQQGLRSYDQCSTKIYGFVAKPALDAVKSALDGIGSVPPPLNSLKSGLANLAADNAVELLMSVPGAEVVTGGIDCGCGLVEAGLKPETIRKVYASLSKVSKKCGEFIKELGPIGQGIVAVTGAISDGWNDTINDPQHMPVNQYFDMHWKPYIEPMSQQLAQPYKGDVWTATVKPVWDRCVNYFDSHNQYRSTAILTCDGMRDGTRDFVGNGGFTYMVYERTWDLATPAVVEYYGRYLANQQVDLSKAAGLNESIRAALVTRIYRDFGLDARGNANRNNMGDVAWREGSFGARTIKSKQRLTGFNSLAHQASRDQIMSALIAKTYNKSPTVEVIKTWQAAYPAILAAKCVSTSLPPRIRVPGSAAKPEIRTTTMTCAEKGVTDAQQQEGLAACDKISGTIKDEINLVCAKPKGEQITDAQVEILKWHKDKRFASANLRCSYDIFWNSKAIGCSDPLYTTQCNQLVAKELGGKFGIPKAGVMDCQFRRSLNEIKWAEAMPQVAQVMAVGFSYNASAGPAKGPECKRDESDPLMLYCAGMPASPTSDGYRLTEQLLGKGMGRECTNEERDDKHWVATPCIVWSRVVAASDSPHTGVGAGATTSIGKNIGASAAIGGKATKSSTLGAPPSLSSPSPLLPPVPPSTAAPSSGIGGNKAASGLDSLSAPSPLAAPSPSSSAGSALAPPTQNTNAARDAAAFKQCKPFLGRMNEMLCSGEPAFKACKKLVDKDEMKTCRLANTKEIYP